MTIISICIIGKQNSPLYFNCFKGDMGVSEYLHLQLISHSSLDIVEERKRKYYFYYNLFYINIIIIRALTSPAGSANFDMYLGLLLPVEGLINNF